MNLELYSFIKESKATSWGKNPKLQCTDCLYRWGIAEWTDNLKLVYTNRGDKLVCFTHQYKRGY